MSDYHILEIDKELKTANVIFHIPIPTQKNVVGTTYRKALVNHLGNTSNINSVLSDITTDELNNMKIGSIYEHRYIVRFSSLYLTEEQRILEIEAAFKEQKQLILNEKQLILRYYGKFGNVI